MGDIIVFFIVLTIFILIIRFIIVSKKKGVKCIGCPNSKQCSGKCSNYSENIYDNLSEFENKSE